MANVLQGAYVQARVWVEADDFNPGYGTPFTVVEDAARKAARDAWHKDGEIEIDDGAKVSLSFQGG